jgi:hypothetical protein
MSIGFVIPLASKSGQCYDPITPHDMWSSRACFVTGALVIDGTLSVLSWILVRAISMHLQVCWNVVPGARFFWGAQVAAWGLPILFANLTLYLSGVSYRFGNVCYLNHEHSLVFWTPMMIIGGTAFLLQICTFLYCARVYLSTARRGETATTNGSALEDLRSNYIPNVYRRIRAVCVLQWRSMALVSVVLLELSLFSILIFFLDRVQQFLRAFPQQVVPWVLCIMQHPTDKFQCTHLMGGIIVRESLPDAAIILFSLVGIVVFLLLVPPSLFVAWRAFFSPSSSAAAAARAPAIRSSHTFPPTNSHSRPTSKMPPPPRRHTDFPPASSNEGGRSSLTRPAPSHHNRSWSSTSTDSTNTTSSSTFSTFKQKHHVRSKTKSSLISDTSSMTDICLDTRIVEEREVQARELQSPSGPRSVFDWNSSPVSRRGHYPWSTSSRR